uniref:Protein translocase subunit SecA n=1 Tax=Phaeomonas parva TaxID=124430 RepID=A0A6U4GUK1_9STRA|mmetsp:Transcript_32752/g.103701  ORF Transcript_32752/g.103701 Transcript_32752/m.103701 type:complete len:943 (+) Transcript_32752:122-2950(+)|eukprot:CAMPEP_0118878306 /NCGR_PEP_ID=MMETSP1163-20130328/18256_1 /TAXON_ID=124430 /ORGANISM="Phaeomonas parva, Strain CCMP2877" /LENGTH=942 /DNA_ID=CAMNT_0006814115 /DNA_START=110 /DNA_END=2938 /DNA_ORIENTATION=+
MAPLRALTLALLAGACGAFRARQPLRMQAASAERMKQTGPNAKVLTGYEKRIAKINAMGDEMAALSPKELRSKTAEFKERLGAGAKEDDILEEAFAVVKEAAFRALGMRHYDVQLMAGMALHEGYLAEMATGEGKTLAATLPAYLNALTGEGAFVVTANDYLAKRDAESMGQVHRILGLSVGLVQAGMTEEERAEAYLSDVTYVNNAEVGFDFLRDNLALDSTQVALTRRPLHFCLVDEADSILIDEARTPLVIAQKSVAPGEKYEAAAKLAAALKIGVHYEVDMKGKTAELTDRGFADASRALGGKDLFDPKDPWAPFVVNAVKAKEIFKKDVDYILRDDEICIVDSFSGRVLEGRRWSDGLHQSVEAKEGIKVDSQSQVTATVTYQNLFKMFPKLCGMSGTAASSSDEFIDVYKLKTLQIPTNLPLARRDYPDVAFKSVDGKFTAVAREVAGAAATGRPVLVGTATVEASELLVEKLKEKGLENVSVLNAKPEAAKREASIIAQAGRAGAVTVSTNMAGRGTDIILGGNAPALARLYVRDAIVAVALKGDDQEMDKLSALDEESLPCAVSDEAQALVRDAVDMICGSDGLLPPRDAAAADLSEETGADDIEELVALAAEKAPVKNPQVLAARAAISAVKDDFAKVLDAEREEVMSLGGLYVVGTEKAESPRVDNQLRGRSGRQGDPGASRFFVSLDDDMMRIFGADKMKGFMETFRVPDDMAIESKQVSKALDRVQQGAEEYFAGIRRQVSEFDGVLQGQREQLYDTRRGLLESDADAVKSRVGKWFTDTATEIAEANAEDAAKAAKVLKAYFPVVKVSEEDLEGYVAKGDKAGLKARATEIATTALDAKWAALEKHRAELAGSAARYLALTQADNLWAEQLTRMNLLKEAVIMRKYQGGVDPLDEYRVEGGKLFDDLLDNVRRNTVYSLMVYQPGPADA